MIPALIHRAVIAKSGTYANLYVENKPLIVAGSGKALRQFIYSSDLARLIIVFLNQYSDTTPVILCPDLDCEKSIVAVAKMVTEKVGLPQGLKFDNSRQDGQLKKTASNKKMRQLFPEFQFTPLEDAIEETVMWLIKNYLNDETRK